MGLVVLLAIEQAQWVKAILTACHAISAHRLPSMPLKISLEINM
jgi:hypothetical protein